MTGAAIQLLDINAARGRDIENECTGGGKFSRYWGPGHTITVQARTNRRRVVTIVMRSMIDAHRSMDVRMREAVRSLECHCKQR